MRHSAFSAAAGFTLAATIGTPNPTLAGDAVLGSLTISRPWSRATPNGARVAAGYMTITNSGRGPDRLIGGSLTQAGRVEVHSMSTEGGVMRMAPVEGGLEIRPGASVTLGPGGYHLMFMDLKAPFRQGATVEGTLTFEKAGTVQVRFDVGSLAAGAPSVEQTDHSLKR